MSKGRYSVRTLHASDVPALVEVIRTVRREYGLERRLQTLIERSDEDLHGTYLRARSNYFVALYGNSIEIRSSVPCTKQELDSFNNA